METPKTEAGRLTEKIMLEVRTRLPEIETPQYNCIYEVVHKVLDDSLPRQPKNAQRGAIPPTAKAVGFLAHL